MIRVAVDYKHFYEEDDATRLTITTDTGVVYEITESGEGIFIERKDRAGIGVKLHGTHKLEVI